MEITVGKFTLETLTSGMYERPKDIYREYIQNAADSIDTAISSKLIKVTQGRINIEINKGQQYVKISDNGTGIGIDYAEKYLLDIGCSPKRLTNARGFRGIGRLAGLAYCRTLLFETSSFGEDKRTLIKIDAQALRERMLNENIEIDLLSLITDAVTVKVEREAHSKHYFNVILMGVEDADGILDVEKVREYLEQVAPVDFDKSFGWGRIIKSKLSVYGFQLPSYNIFVCDGCSNIPLSKSYRDTMISDRLRKIEDKISEVEVKVFNINDETVAYLWFARTSFYGTLQDESIKGMRMRKGNILIGDKTTLNHVFKDERFNGWLFGELHIISDRLIPNARRDELEKNSVYSALMDDLRAWAESMSYEIRKISNQRSSDKRAQRVIEYSQDKALTNIDNMTTVVIPESTLMGLAETDQVNHSELVTALDILISAEQTSTKFKALNLQNSITVEQKKVLERVFDILCGEEGLQADALITKIIKGFVPKYVVFG